MPTKTIDIADTNMALFGSDIEKKLKYNNAKSEPAWKGCGQKEGVQVWRIEKFEVKSWPEKAYGQFYEGDSYIVLQTYKKTKEATALSHNIFFWLGSGTTQDEAGTAAYKTVELDDFFNGEPVQHREVHGQESTKFLSLFPTIEILKGGIESGFRHVEAKQDDTVRLLHVRGTKNFVRVLEVNPDCSALNSGDCFVLLKSNIIRVWQGESSSGFERNKAVSYAKELGSAKAKMEVMVTGQADAEVSEFYSALGGLKGSIAAPVEEKSSSAAKSLHKVSDSSGKLEFTKVGSPKITMSQFDAGDVFVFDIGHELFVWVGNGASDAERKGWLHLAGKYLQQSGRNPATPVVAFKQGGEPKEFVESLDR